MSKAASFSLLSPLKALPFSQKPRLGGALFCPLAGPLDLCARIYRVRNFSADSARWLMPSRYFSRSKSRFVPIAPTR